jgi:hypothetical protein
VKIWIVHIIDANDMPLALQLVASQTVGELPSEKPVMCRGAIDANVFASGAAL